MSKVKYVGKLHKPILAKEKHCHEFFEVVCYTSGNGFVDLDGEIVPFSAGDVFVIPPQVEHSDYAENGFENYHYEFEDSAFPYKKWVYFRDNESGDFLDMTKKLYREVQLKRPNYKEIVENLYNVLFNYILAFYGKEQFSVAVESAINDMIDNFTNPNYNLSKYIKEIPLNEDYFRRTFIKETGLTPLQYLIDMRINHAKRLLRYREKNNLSIQEIAWMSGFADNLYFSRVFKKATGVAPREWK